MVIRSDLEEQTAYTDTLLTMTKYNSPLISPEQKIMKRVLCSNWSNSASMDEYGIYFHNSTKFTLNLDINVWRQKCSGLWPPNNACHFHDLIMALISLHYAPIRFADAFCLTALSLFNLF